MAASTGGYRTNHFEVHLGGLPSRCPSRRPAQILLPARPRPRCPTRRPHCRRRRPPSSSSDQARRQPQEAHRRPRRPQALRSRVRRRASGGASRGHCRPRRTRNSAVSRGCSGSRQRGPPPAMRRTPRARGTPERLGRSSAPSRSRIRSGVPLASRLPPPPSQSSRPPQLSRQPPSSRTGAIFRPSREPNRKGLRAVPAMAFPQGTRAQRPAAPAVLAASEGAAATGCGPKRAHGAVSPSHLLRPRQLRRQGRSRWLHGSGPQAARGRARHLC